MSDAGARGGSGASTGGASNGGASAGGESLVVHDVAALTNLGVLARKAVALDAQALIRVRALPAGSPDDLVAASRPAGVARVWATTPFGPVACRTMAISPGRGGRDDVVVRADAVSAVTGDARSVPQIDAAVPMTLECGAAADSSWPGSVPVDGGWTVVDAVPAGVFRDLETQARGVAKEESGPLGLPTSLLDQKVLTVRGARLADTSGNEGGLTAGAAGRERGATAAAGRERGATAAAGRERGATAAAGREVGPVAEISMREVFALCAMGFIPVKPSTDEPVRVSVKGRWRRLDGRFGSVYASEGLGVLPL
ncbi:hypothetical protein [Corynebacterium freneyi]|uniref:Uncharacterized protein n=1 Tax=Corynebacterium freneyi TaxID=134034 RepID=A0ABS4U9L0_9CORY|nr:hypothetical protein [Corynebacterium freneyi]MBP2333224.1 hypothetical protein [Corynebacterium freneyi]QXA52711.1 hypothetical protein I6L56_11875 [Corynebacterium freneyi]WJZ04673.1 hypothetical protein CFREN_03465 [Corynebacterium freneyi]